MNITDDKQGYMVTFALADKKPIIIVVQYPQT